MTPERGDQGNQQYYKDMSRLDNYPDNKATVDQMIKIISIDKGNIFFTGAAEDEVAELEKKLKASLPPSFKQFLSFSNGALLYQTEEILAAADGGRENFNLQNSIFTIRAGLDRHPAYLIPFHNSNNPTFFDTRTQDNEGEYPVCKWDEDQQLKLIAPNFAVWLKDLVNRFELT